jgi:hypothetical protein
MHDDNVICFLEDDINDVVSIIDKARRYVKCNIGENAPLANDLERARCFLSGGGSTFPEVLKKYTFIQIAEAAAKGNAETAIGIVGNRFHEYWLL